MQTTGFFNEFVVKIASRCNINCDYCYEYNLGDDSWRNNSKLMSLDVAKALANRISEHAVAHDLKYVSVSFHGGEPLLAGADRIDALASVFLQAANDKFELSLSTQTNGVLLSEPICRILKRHGISLSISLDGGKMANDRHRLDMRGRSTYSRALRGIATAKAHMDGQPSGLLAVIDIADDPIDVFDSLAELGIPNIDFLLPHYHWSRPPRRTEGVPNEYAVWLFTIFEAWVSGRHSSVNIRFFDNVIRQLTGLESNFEVMNLSPVRLVTINTDGDIEAVDTLKSTASGAQKTGLNVKNNTFDDAFAIPTIAARQTGANQLCYECQSCKFMGQCAGGYFPHRYSEKNGFDNPSVYCEDLYWLLDKVTQRLKLHNSVKTEK